MQNIEKKVKHIQKYPLLSNLFYYNNGCIITSLRYNIILINELSKFILQENHQNIKLFEIKMFSFNTFLYYYFTVLDSGPLKANN